MHEDVVNGVGSGDGDGNEHDSPGLELDAEEVADSSPLEPDVESDGTACNRRAAGGLVPAVPEAELPGGAVPEAEPPGTMLRNSVPIAALQQIIDNMAKSAHTHLVGWQNFYTSLKVLEHFLRGKESRDRFIKTCIRDTPSAGHEHLCKKMKLHCMKIAGMKWCGSSGKRTT